MKRIKRHIYYIQQIKKVDGKFCYVTNEDGSLFSGIYKTKIYPQDLPEWYQKDRYYKKWGYMSTKGIVDMVYVHSRLGTFLKNDVLLVSYVNKIERVNADSTAPIYSSYRGYDEEVSGSAILTILAGAKKYSNFDIKLLKKQITDQIIWLKEQYPNDYREGEWLFDIDEVIVENNGTAKNKRKKKRNY